MKKLSVFAAIFLSLGLLPLAEVRAANDFGSMSQVVGSGKSMTVGLNSSPTGYWFVVSASNPSVADGYLLGNSLIVSGKAVGNSAILVCSELSAEHCLKVNVVVSGILGAFTSASAHAPNNWVKDGLTVYYVHSSGLIPVPSWPLFVSNGGKSKKIKPANAADLSLPMQDLMTQNDPRVKK